MGRTARFNYNRAPNPPLSPATRDHRLRPVIASRSLGRNAHDFRLPVRRAAAARDSIQLYVVLRPGDRGTPPGTGILAIDRGATLRAPHRTICTDVVRSARGHVGHREK